MGNRLKMTGMNGAGKVYIEMLAWVLIFFLFGNEGFTQQLPKPSAPFHPTASGQTPQSDQAAVEEIQPSSLPSISLQELITQAMEQNPEIKSMQRNFDRMRARIPQATALPEPTFSYSYAGNITPLPPFDLQTDDPASARMLNFTQEIPFPGKLALKGKMAAVEAEEQCLLQVLLRSWAVP